MSAPSRLNLSCGFTLIRTMRSPFAPFAFCSPSPLIRYSPVSMPGGMSKLKVLVPFCLPDPLHLEHGLSIIFPCPLHVLQGCTVTKVENPLLREVLTCPCPLHTVHVRAVVPGVAPVPLQSPHGFSLGSSISSCLPVSTSSSAISVSYTRSAPRWPPYPKSNPPKPNPPPPLPKRFWNIDSNPDPKMSSKFTRDPWKMSSVLYLLSTPA